MDTGHAPDNPDGRDIQEASVPGSQWLDWPRGRVAVVGRGLLLFGLALAGLVPLLALAAALGVLPVLAVRSLLLTHKKDLALVVAILAIVGWLVVGPLILLCMRSLARLTRRLVGRWCAVPIAEPYLPPPWADGGKAGLRRRYAWLLTDQATWRDLLWVTVDGCVGWVLAVLPAGLWASPVAAARLRPVRPVHARADPAGGAGAAGSPARPDPHRGH